MASMLALNMRLGVLCALGVLCSGQEAFDAFSNEVWPPELLRASPRALPAYDPREDMTVPELVKLYGYGMQESQVTTGDGYVLTLHRLLARTVDCSQRRSRAHQRSAGRCKPVLLQHGFLGSSSAWVMNEPDKALAYILADRGYDVWMGNARGNSYSIGHTSLDVNSYEYWDFCFDQMGQHDLPAVIRHILLRAKHGWDKLHYIGHSMGTSMFFAMESLVPGFARNRVSSFTALGPVAFLNSTEALLRYTAPVNRFIDTTLRDILGAYHLNTPHDDVISRFLTAACLKFTAAEEACRNLLFLLIGFDDQNLDMSWFNIIMKQLNAGGSVRTLVHFAQMVQSGQFRMFDFYKKNMDHYNATEPPNFKLTSIDTPMMLRWGLNDKLADPKDVKRLCETFEKKLPFNFTHGPVADPNFNHLDFLWGKNAKELCYEDVIAFIESN